MSERFERQVCFDKIGVKQEKLLKASVCIVGCGGVGSISAELVARMGVGKLTLIDDERIEESNLHRQLYSEKDVGKPKASVLFQKVKRSGNTKKIFYHTERLTEKNADLLSRHDIILDCTDNMETRFLINKFCEEKKVPWIYAGAQGSVATIMPVMPGTGLFEKVFGKTRGKKLPACDSVINGATTAAASMQVTEAVKILIGEKPKSEITYFDVWTRDVTHASAGK